MAPFYNFEINPYWTFPATLQTFQEQRCLGSALVDLTIENRDNYFGFFFRVPIHPSRDQSGSFYWDAMILVAPIVNGMSLGGREGIYLTTWVMNEAYKSC